jgi:hypothetical protein
MVHLAAFDLKFPHRAIWITLAAGSLLSLVVSFRIAAGTFVLGSSRGGWVHNYLYPFQFRSIAIFAIVCACCAVPALVPLSTVRRREWTMVAMWFAIGLFAQGVLRSLSPYTMEGLFLGDGSNGFFQPTLQYSSVEILRDFNHLRLGLPEHPRTNMPGKLILIYALEIMSTRPSVLPWLAVIVSNIGGLFLYLFVRDWLNDCETALASLVLYMFVPAKLLFFPVLNTVTPAFVFLCAWLWVRALSSGRPIYAVALGAASYWILFFEPTPAVTGLLFVALTAYALWRGEVAWRTVVRQTAGIVAGFVATYVLALVILRFDLWSTMRAVAADAVEFNARVRRPYYPWVVENLLDLAYGAGVSQAVLYGVGAIVALRRFLTAGGTEGRWAALVLGIGIAIVATDLAGINRGEVVRLWVFMACFLQIPAAYLCRRLESPLALILVLATTLLQIALSASMMAFAQP